MAVAWSCTDACRASRTSTRTSPYGDPHNQLTGSQASVGYLPRSEESFGDSYVDKLKC